MGAAALLLGATGQSGDAVANGDTRSISIFHTHTREELTVVYKRDGQFDSAGLEKLNWALRDWRLDQPTRMDPRLFDIVWEVHRAAGSQEPFNIVSAYRSPQTNAMLRQRSAGVAEHSQHMLGKAMDFYLPDVPLAKIREIGLRMQRGGVGYYPTSGSPFVHLDVGGVRHWPRMTRDQLARIFPDGKTVHIPTDGRPMPGYDLALAEIQANGGTASDYGSGPTLGRKSFFAALFGGGEDDSADSAPRGRGKVASRQVAAYAPAPSARDDGDDSRTFFLFQQQKQAEASAPALARPAPRPALAPPVEAAASQPAEAAPAAASSAQVPMVPLPLARPRDLPAPAATLLASAAPQPPLPAGPLAQAAPAETAAPGEPAGRIGLVPVPTARPDDLDPRPLAATVPLPPARPQLASLVASLPPVSQGASLAAPPDHSGSAPPRSAAPQSVQNPESADRSVRALFAPPASIAPRTTGSVGSVSAAKAKPALRDDVGSLTRAPTATIAMVFSQGGLDNPQPDHFAGPAVQPLKVTSFAPAR